MKAIILIDKTAAIMEGREQFGEITVEFSVADVPEHLRPVLAAAPVNGCDNMIVLSAPVPHNAVWYHTTKEAPRPVLAHADDPLFAAVTWLQWRLDMSNALEAEARQQAEEYAAHQAELKRLDQERLEAYVAFWSDKSPEEWLHAIGRHSRVHGYFMPGGCSNRDGFPEPPCDREAAAAALASNIEAAEALRDQRAAEDRAKHEAERQQAEEAAKARRETIAGYIAEYGTESQRERQEAGLLDEEEALDAIGAVLFTNHDEFSPFRDARMDDLSHQDGCEAREDALEVTIEPITGLDHDEWSLFKAIKEAAPKNPEELSPPESSTVTLCAKRYWCAECEAEIVRVFAAVELVIGEGIGAVTLVQRYQIGDRAA